MAADLATRWLMESGNSLRVFEGWCLQLAEEVGQWLRQEGIDHMLVYIESLVENSPLPLIARYASGERRWRFHAVLFVKGKIHDAWLGRAVIPSAYFAEVFPGQKIRAEYLGEDPKRDFEKMETWKGSRRLSVVRP
jgi:hypothetical protein